jgi:hypothetical protein
VDHQKFGRKDFKSVCTVLCFRASILNHGLRFSQDIQVADQEFPFAFMNFAINVLGMIGTFVFITMATPLLAFALPFLAAIGASFLKFYLATSKVHSPSTAPMCHSWDIQQFRRLESASKSPVCLHIVLRILFPETVFSFTRYSELPCPGSSP